MNIFLCNLTILYLQFCHYAACFYFLAGDFARVIWNSSSDWKTNESHLYSGEFHYPFFGVKAYFRALYWYICCNVQIIMLLLTLGFVQGV
jgi:hypothetical protein